MNSTGIVITYRGQMYYGRLVNLTVETATPSDSSVILIVVLVCAVGLLVIVLTTVIIVAKKVCQIAVIAFLVLLFSGPLLPSAFS